MKKLEECLIHIIEDDEQSRKLITNIIKKENMNTLEAENGMVALKQLEENHTPDLFLIDIMMPNMDGFELIKKIRTIDRFQTTPIIMTTALDDAKHIKEAIAVGANAYIVKPINISRLKSKLNEFLQTNNS